MLAETYQTAKVKDRYERDGKGYAIVWQPCDRCGGSGTMPFAVYNGRCFKCNGSGGSHIEVRDYSDKEWATIQKRKATIAAKKEAKRKAELPKKNTAFIQRYGFDSEYIYAVVGSTFDMKDMLEDAGATYRPEVGWFFNEPKSGYITVPIHFLEIFEINEYGVAVVRDEAADEVNDHKARMDEELDARFSEHVGTIGNKITITVWLANTFSYHTQWGQTNVHKFLDTHGNVYVWKTQKYLNTGDTYTVTGTIKAHDEYDGIAQTALTRCKTK